MCNPITLILLSLYILFLNKIKYVYLYINKVYISKVNIDRIKLDRIDIDRV